MKDPWFDDVETTQLTIFENDSPILGLQYLNGTQDGAPDVARRPPAERIQEALMPRSQGICRMDSITTANIDVQKVPYFFQISNHCSPVGGHRQDFRHSPQSPNCHIAKHRQRYFARSLNARGPTLQTR